MSGDVALVGYVGLAMQVAIDLHRGPRITLQRSSQSPSSGPVPLSGIPAFSTAMSRPPLRRMWSANAASWDADEATSQYTGVAFGPARSAVARAPASLTSATCYVGGWGNEGSAMLGGASMGNPKRHTQSNRVRDVHTVTWQPCFARSTQIARPMPLPPPVTKADAPRKDAMLLSLYSDQETTKLECHCIGMHALRWS